MQTLSLHRHSIERNVAFDMYPSRLCSVSDGNDIDWQKKFLLCGSDVYKFQKKKTDDRGNSLKECCVFCVSFIKECTELFIIEWYRFNCFHFLLFKYANKLNNLKKLDTSVSMVTLNCVCMCCLFCRFVLSLLSSIWTTIINGLVQKGDRVCVRVCAKVLKTIIIFSSSSSSQYCWMDIAFFCLLFFSFNANNIYRNCYLTCRATASFGCVCVCVSIILEYHFAIDRSA